MSKKAKKSVRVRKLPVANRVLTINQTIRNEAKQVSSSIPVRSSQVDQQLSELSGANVELAAAVDLLCDRLSGLLREDIPLNGAIAGQEPLVAVASRIRTEAAAVRISFLTITDLLARLEI